MIMSTRFGDGLVPASSDQDRVTFNDSTFPRIKVNHQSLCGPFLVEQKYFTTQYFPFYVARLNAIKPAVQKSAVSKWGSKIRIATMSDMNARDDPEVVIIGILFKKMTNQPTVLREISSEDNQIVPLSTCDCYISEDDYLILQDEKENVKLVGNISVDAHVTGIVVGLKGRVDPDGKDFIVEDVCYPSLPNPYNEGLLPPIETKYILFLSGLGFSKTPTTELQKATQLLRDFIAGWLTGKEAEKADDICRIIIAGNLVGESVRAEELAADETHGKPWLKQLKPYFVNIMEKVDDFASNLGRTIGLEIMSGPTDPSCQPLPQQPMNPCILPKSSILSSIRCVTNPYAALFDSRLLIGSSGQNIDNIRRFSNLTDPIDIMEKTLIWSHLAPTVPDTLHGLNVNPKDPIDPFVLKNLPDVYFIGNQPEFVTAEKKIGTNHNVRFICIPKFEKTFSGVLLNLKDLTCEKISFG